MTWQNALVDYLVGKNMRSAFYWCWNADSGDTGGILNSDWTTVRTDKVNLLHKLWGTDGSGGGTSGGGTSGGSTSGGSTSGGGTSGGGTSGGSTSGGSTSGGGTSGGSTSGGGTSGGGTSGGSTSGGGTSSGSPSFSTKVIVDSDWQAGYCERVQVTNTGGTAGNWSLTQTISGKVNNLWNATWTQSGSTLSTSGLDSNKTLAPGAMTEFGFCANR